jgi:hypothetical protein
MAGRHGFGSPTWHRFYPCQVYTISGITPLISSGHSLHPQWMGWVLLIPEHAFNLEFRAHVLSRTQFFLYVFRVKYFLSQRQPHFHVKAHAAVPLVWQPGTPRCERGLRAFQHSVHGTYTARTFVLFLLRYPGNEFRCPVVNIPASYRKSSGLQSQLKNQSNCAKFFVLFLISSRPH